MVHQRHRVRPRRPRPAELGVDLPCGGARLLQRRDRDSGGQLEQGKIGEAVDLQRVAPQSEPADGSDQISAMILHLHLSSLLAAFLSQFLTKS